MSVIQFRPDDLVRALNAPVPVPVPIGLPVSQVESKSFAASATARTRAGVWQCSPGRWRRQVRQSEFCHFIEGDCTFIPDDGAPIDIKAGDVLYFPANSMGTWDIRARSRKIFIVFDEADRA